ncbi:hypothetical protein CBR_g30216 [Chara braunii]|uniref:Integrase catalytic domain-containing protein n=1 Tax=Chara braunii TaxID=69332 RepID=A0A388LCE4_CHABU|nr:hypothetical protein CBR_g30216 [Chara braunii]|eukprot:GBG79954.1 hypothetical protein CBR_g30216 [Chara braunii]
MRSTGGAVAGDNGNLLLSLVERHPVTSDKWNWKRRPTKMPEDGGAGRVLTLEDLIAALDRHEKTPSNLSRVETFHFDGERVFDWPDLVEQAMVGLSDEVKFQRIMRLEEDFDVERMVDRLLEGHNDLMNLKDILASAPRLREELKGRLSRRLMPNVHLSAILPREVGSTQAGTRMDWKCAACGLVDLVVKEKKCVAMMDTGAEMNIIRERDALMLGMEIDRADHGVLHGANCKAVFCGTTSNVIIEIGKVWARTCFFVMPDVDHPILLGRSFMCRTETLIFNKHDGTMILLLSDPSCGNYEVVTCRNTGLGSERNRPNPGSFTYVESENERRRLAEEPEEEDGAEVLSLSLTDISKAMEIVAAHEMADPEAIKALREHVLESPRAGKDLQRLNAVTVRDARGLPNADALSESCAGSPIISLIDLYSGYDQFSVYPPDRPVTAMHTPRGLIHMNVASQGWTNAVAMVQRHMIRAMQTVSPHITQPYIDDLAVKGPKEKEEDEVQPRVRRFVWRHIQDLDRVLGLLEEHNLTASGPKSKHCMREATILGFVCNEKGRKPDVKKTDKILEWPVSFQTITDVRNFLGTCGFWRSFVKDFAAKTEHLRKLVRQDQEWVWGEDQEEAVTRMKGEFREVVLAIPKGYERKADLVLKPFQEEDQWGGKDTQWMMKLALAGTHGLVEERRTIEEGPTQVEENEQLMGGLYLLTNTLLQGDFDQRGSFSHEENEILIPESQDDEFEEGEIKEAFRAEEYDGIYLELGLLLSCEMRDRDASDKAQKLRHLYVVRDGHLFIKRQVGNPKRIVCGRNRQLDIIAALHDGIAGGHRGIGATCAKISELYHWDGMLTMVIKYCQSCVPCQERSAQRPGEPLHPRLEREVDAVVHLDLLFMLVGDNGCDYIFDARDNLTGFVDGRAIRTKTDPVLANCIEEYYLRYPFVGEFVMDRGSEFTYNEVRTLLAGYGVVANYTTVAHLQANAPVERGHSTITNLLAKSDFLKATMQRGGRGTRPRQRPLGASRGEERHGPFRREPTPVFDDDNIELFLDAYQEHVVQRGWDVSERVRHLRGVGRFEEPIAQIREEALTWSEVKTRMQRLRASPLGNDELPIRLEEGNVEEFIPAYEQYMSDQGVPRDEWAQTLLIWTRGEERPLARQIQGRARDWEDCRAQLRVAFRRPEPERPEPRVDRRRRSKRLWDLEARESVASRGGWKALAQREGGQAGSARARESFPACGLRQVEFHRVTYSDLLGPLPQAPERRESEVPAAPFEGLEAHLDASQWEAPSAGGSPIEPSGGEQTRLEPETEPLRLKGVGAEDVIMVEGDTPPGSPARAQMRRAWPEGEVEARGPAERWRTEPRLVIDSRLAAHAAEHPDIEGSSLAGPSSRPACAESEGGPQTATGEVSEAGARKEPDVAAQAKRARVRARFAEIHERRDRMEAAGIAPRPLFAPKTSEERIDELWARYEGRKEAARQRAREAGQTIEGADEAIEVGELGFTATRRAIEWVDKGIKQTSIEAFQRYSLLSDELALRKDKVEQLTAQLAEERAESKATQARLEAKETEWEAKLKEMAATVERLAATKVIDLTEQSRYDIQGKEVQGLFGQEEAAEASRQEKLGKVFLDPAETEARKEANKGSFEFKAPTELASQQEDPASTDTPMEALTQEPQPAPEEEEAPEESLAILLDVREGTLTGAVEPPQLEAQGEGPSRLDELIAAMEVDTPPERPQGLEAPEHEPKLEELRVQLGSWATRTDSGGPTTDQR